MKRSILLFLCLIALLSGSACSIQIEQEGPPTQTASEPANGVGNIPVTWGNLNLTGRLIYVATHFKRNNNAKGGLSIDVKSLDLATGNVTTIFETPLGGWIDSMAVAPDLKNLIISYAPSSDPPLGGKKALYIMPLDGSQPPQLLFTPPSDKDQYYQPDWSPDGKYIYFTHVNNPSSSATYEVMRFTYPNGKLEGVANQAYWPRLSRDGFQIVYVSIESASGPNGLFIANADGTDARPVPLLGSGWINSIIDAPLFLPDGQTILFSGPIPLQGSAPSWIEKLLGTTVAYAHGSIPSDWWSVPLTGGEPIRLTHIYSPGLFASLSPDLRYIASYSASGIFVMNPAGGDLTQVVNFTGGILGTVSWIP
jgi:Tol biopolymer transport system component